MRRGRLGGSDREADVFAVGAKLHILNHTERYILYGSKLVAGRIEQKELASAVFIGSKSDCLAVFAEGEILNVPSNARSEIAWSHRGEIEVGEPLKVRIAIRHHIDAFAVSAEIRRAIENMLAIRLCRSDLVLLAIGEID
jgi:hypothetical protein